MSKSRGYTICSVRGCQKTSANSNCRFFRFPKDERLKQWAIACRREDLLEKPLENVYSAYRICSDHFEDRMYANDLKNRLLPSAKPTLNLGENVENDRNNVNNPDNRGSSTVVTPLVIGNKKTEGAGKQCIHMLYCNPVPATKKLEDEIKRLQGVIELMKKQHHQDLQVQADMFKELMSKKEEELKKKKTDVQTELRLFKRQVNRKNSKTAMKTRMLLDLIKESNIVSGESYNALEKNFDFLFEDKNQDRWHNYAKIDDDLEVLPPKRHRLTTQIFLNQ